MPFLMHVQGLGFLTLQHLADSMSHTTLATLNDDVILSVLEHLLADNGPRNNTNILLISRSVMHSILGRFHREIYIANISNLTGALDSISTTPRLATHVHILHFTLEAQPLFTSFNLIVSRMLEYHTHDPITIGQLAVVANIICHTADNVRSLALLAPFCTATVVLPVLAQSFRMLTELAAPVHFLFTLHSAYSRGVPFDPTRSGAFAPDPTWPNLRSVWMFICETTQFLDRMDLRMDLRHLNTLKHLAITFRYLSNEDVLNYLQNLRILPTLDCVAVEIASAAPPFPLYHIVQDAYFFDPRLVFVHPGTLSTAYRLLIRSYARQKTSVIYDLLLEAADDYKAGWVEILAKVAERRGYAVRNGTDQTWAINHSKDSKGSGQLRSGYVQYKEKITK
ncbi:hypothetical protein V5O48_002166 [Marasmius crinis-equi]|uniref:Uncharacterized protein n=1 Tax=Marasmius crinis-equi TaxID=585013 RepID=A0ABR3FWL0_9AGAR